ncbi:hypothetical protein [Yersinia kristensenii]|uniref:hypothetical protein n=1 Tax=Yersinia kristensenii TaxID=28152 RepID=UPI000518D710|nr:hypothetical protein [Yersinia kristensenii]PEH53429.1 hypothetical protein CRM81_08830 [Yersinia kristensenii]SUP67189.1 Uncharacterised protein [Yersinia kristensenii]
MSNFDRELQLQLLELAVNHYPDSIDKRYIPENLLETDERKLLQNIAYLNEEGLISGGVMQLLAGKIPVIELITATKDAVNLLSEEGSISASLKVVTVKLHDDSLAVIRDFINQNVTDPEERKGYLQRIKELPADATKHIVLELLGKGLNQLPNAALWLQTALHSS